jgi:hypothetical protein
MCRSSSLEEPIELGPVAVVEVLDALAERCHVGRPEVGGGALEGVRGVPEFVGVVGGRPAAPSRLYRAVSHPLERRIAAPPAPGWTAAAGEGSRTPHSP